MSGLSNIVGLVIAALAIFLTATLVDQAGFGTGYTLVAIGLYLAWFSLVFSGAKEREERAIDKIKDTLIEGEGIVEVGIDTRPHAFFSRRKVFAITNSRVIVVQRGLLGGRVMHDMQWQFLENARVNELVLPEFCGSELVFDFGWENPSLIVWPASEIANKMYKYAQAQEQAWKEKNRIRQMEENRAAAGGFVIPQSYPMPPQQYASGWTHPPTPQASQQAPAPQASQQTPAPQPSWEPAVSETSQRPTVSAVENLAADSEREDVGNASQGSGLQSGSSALVDELLQFKRLLDDGIISDTEFQEIKSKIIASRTGNF